MPLKLLNGLYGTSISRERRSRVGGDSGFWFQHVGGKSSTGRRVVFIKAVEGEDGTRGARAAEVEQKVCDSALRGQKSSRVRNKSRIRYAGTYVPRREHGDLASMNWNWTGARPSAGGREHGIFCGYATECHHTPLLDGWRGAQPGQDGRR